MPAPYSYDLRKKAIEAIKRGQRKTDVCRLLKISRNTLDLWLKRERTSWISALKEGKVFATLTFEGSCNRDLFETWLAKSLIPKLNPGDIIILDNASFHKGETIREIVKEAGCELWYLPAYSPDLNKIENWWSVLKTWMKQRLTEFETVRDCVDSAFKNCPNVFA